MQSVYQQDDLRHLTVKSNYNGAIKFYNLIGQLVKETSFLKNNTNIDISDLNRNIYIVRIVSGNKTTTKKIIIK